MLKRVVGAGAISRPDQNAAVGGELARNHRLSRPLAGLLALSLIVAGGAGLGGWLTGPGGLLTASSPIPLEDSSAALHWSAGWTVVGTASASGGSEHASSLAGASVSLVYYGSYLQIVAPTGPGRGVFTVTIDKTAASVSTYATAYHPQQVVFRAGPAGRRHVLTLRVDGTAGHPLVAIDAVFIRPLQLVDASRRDPTPTPTVAPCGMLQARINAAAAGVILDLSGCTYTAGATVNKSLTLTGATIRPPAGAPGLTVTANNVTLNGLTIVGQGASTYNQNEMGIIVDATAGNPVSHLTIENSDIGNFGYGGMYLRWVTDLLVQNNHVYDGVYAGIMILSGERGTVQGNTVQRIGVVGSATNGGNAYGIALSQLNPATDAPTADFTVSGNTVEDVPTWHAFDTHAGQNIIWTGNTASGSRFGLFVTGSDAGGRALNNDIHNNRFEAPTNANQYAIVSVYSTGGDIHDNTIVGWPSGHAILTTSGGDPTATAQSIVIGPNSIQ